MSYAEFYMRASGGDDLNAGSTSADVGGGSNSAVYTSTAGNFDGTSVFTPTDGSTPASSVSTGDYVALYNTGDTVCRCVAQVVTVAAGVNGAITVSTTIKYGTVPTSNSGSRALKAGGSWASLAMVATNGALNTGTVPQSTRINIKAGTYANTSTSRSVALAGSATANLWWRGYKTTPGDQDTNNVQVAGTDNPLFTWTSGTFTSTGTLSKFFNMAFTSASNGNPTALFQGAQLILCRCALTNTSANNGSWAMNDNNSTSALFMGCSFTATTSAGRIVSAGSTIQNYFQCTFTGGATAVFAGGSTFVNCVFDSQAGDAISSFGVTIVIGCSFYSPTGNGINFTSVTGTQIVMNCYFENVNQASKSAINNTSGANTGQIYCIANAYFNCTATITGITETFSVFDNGTLASAGFIAAASQNFGMLGVGQNLGFPGLFESTNTYRGFLDVGAVQGGHVNRSRSFSGF